MLSGVLHILQLTSVCAVWVSVSKLLIRVSQECRTGPIAGQAPTQHVAAHCKLNSTRAQGWLLFSALFSSA